jgi:hypothetical protein
LAHGLDRWAHSLERQRFPRGEVGDLGGVDVLAQVVVELPGHGAGWACDDEGSAIAQVGECGNGDGSPHVADGEPSGRIAERASEPRLIAQQGRQCPQIHERSPRFVGRAVAPVTTNPMEVSHGGFDPHGDDRFHGIGGNGNRDVEQIALSGGNA